jgi:hypothetical protein
VSHPQADHLLVVPRKPTPDQLVSVGRDYSRVGETTSNSISPWC